MQNSKLHTIVAECQGRSSLRVGQVGHTKRTSAHIEIATVVELDSRGPELLSAGNAVDRWVIKVC
jgi:hypothetical protein